MMQDADATAFVALKPTHQGGRRSPTPTGVFGCILQIDGRNHDVRLETDPPLAPGTTRRVAIMFLDPAATRELHEGDAFTLWEGKEIGFGRIEQVGKREVEAALHSM